MATLGVTVGVVDGNVGDGEAGSTVDGEALDWGVLDGDAGDLGVGKVMGVEELGLGDTTVAALAVPPEGTLAIEDGTIGSLNGDTGARDGEKGTLPLGVFPGSSTFEDDLYRR